MSSILVSNHAGRLISEQMKKIGFSAWAHVQTVVVQLLYCSKRNKTEGAGMLNVAGFVSHGFLVLDKFHDP
jgi:hypothetical protein